MCFLGGFGGFFCSFVCCCFVLLGCSFLFGLGFFLFGQGKLNVISKGGKDEALGPSYSVFHTNKLPGYSQDHR